VSSKAFPGRHCPFVGVPISLPVPPFCVFFHWGVFLQRLEYECPLPLRGPFPPFFRRSSALALWSALTDIFLLDPGSRGIRFRCGHLSLHKHSFFSSSMDQPAFHELSLFPMFEEASRTFFLLKARIYRLSLLPRFRHRVFHMHSFSQPPHGT